MKKKVPSIKELKELCLKKGTYVGADRVYSIIAVYFTKLFLYTPLSSIHIMFLWFFLQLFSCYLVFQGSYFYVVGGIILFQFCASILDAVDGQMDRYNGKNSLLGLYLDQIIHNITNPIFLLTLALTEEILGIGILSCIFYIYNRLVVFNPCIYNLKYEKDKYVIKQIIEPRLNKLSYSRLKRDEKNFISNAYEWFRVEHLFNVIFFGAVLGLLKWTLYLYLILFMVDFVRRLYMQVTILIKADKILNSDEEEK